MIPWNKFHSMSRTNLVRSMATRVQQLFCQTGWPENESLSQQITADIKTELETTLDCPRYIAQHIAVTNHTLRQQGVATLKENAIFLQYATYANKTIYNYPEILTLNPTTLMNRLTICRECHIHLSLPVLYNFEDCNKASIALLRAYSLIPADWDVISNLIKRAQGLEEHSLDVPPLTEKNTLDVIYLAVIKAYLKRKMRLQHEHLLNKLTKNHVRDLSFTAFKSNLFYLLNFAGFTREMVLANFRFMKYMNAGSLFNLMKFYQSRGCNFPSFLRQKPILLTLQYSQAQSILSVLEEFNVPCDVSLSTPKVFTLSPYVLRERLKVLCSHKEIEIFKFHPRFLECTLKVDFVIKQLNWCRQLDFKKLSMSLLLDNSGEFTLRTSRTGTDDLLIYLGKQFRKADADIVVRLNRHPYWRTVPLIQVDETLQFLLNNNFTKEDIYKSIHIVLYPRVRIEMELASLNRRKFTVCRDAPDTSVPGFTVSPVVKKEFILPLILYFMEKETNFAFDAIWIDNKIVEKDDECELNDDIPEEVFHNYAKHPMPKASPAADAKQAQFVT
ncbi:unnamed protein product [Bemisia tabaci]|uniref:Uncharacterized protein n=1 Tax=Bemisia tabaci TaxID=7038 RepID=A0A9P0A107_BEMTA|nr:unnamed protein product [Bemisia tabaci]